MSENAAVTEGARYGRWTVLRQATRPSYWVCRCDCKRRAEVFSTSLRLGRSQSCGCIQREGGGRRTTHGATGTLTYRRWRYMLDRCHNPKASGYEKYGARGITVCERWHAFEHFLADMGECPDVTMSIDRRKNHLGYAPGNCRWATPVEQARNKTTNRTLTHNGVTLTLSGWAEVAGVSARAISGRLARGWSIERALTTQNTPHQRRVRAAPGNVNAPAPQASASDLNVAQVAALMRSATPTKPLNPRAGKLIRLVAELMFAEHVREEETARVAEAAPADDNAADARRDLRPLLV